MYTRSSMFILNMACLSLLLSSERILAADDIPALGRTLNDSATAELPQHVFADGSGLPSGSGNASDGEPLFRNKCAGCHGSNGQGGSAIELVGDRALLATEYPDRGVAVFWPYAPTLFEYIRRSMPPEEPYSMSPDQLYAVIARLLELNGLVESGQRVDAEFLSALQMPNRDGFRSAWD